MIRRTSTRSRILDYSFSASWSLERGTLRNWKFGSFVVDTTTNQPHHHHHHHSSSSQYHHDWLPSFLPPLKPTYPYLPLLLLLLFLRLFGAAAVRERQEEELKNANAS